MKKLFICAGAFLFTATITMGQQTKSKSKAKPAVKTAAAAKPIMKNLSDSFSYAAGMNIASNMKEQGIANINTALMAKAIDDVFQDKTKALTIESANACLQAQMMIYDEKKKAESGKKIAAEVAKGRAFLEANKMRPGVFTLPDGLQFEVINPGDSTGAKPAASDTVIVNYVGKLIDGTEFDASKSGPITYQANGFIKGWTEALLLMTKGAHWKLYVPAELGYGDRGSGRVPPGATMIFDMTLVDFKPAAVK